jgi:hypothetical protein
MPCDLLGADMKPGSLLLKEAVFFFTFVLTYQLYVRCVILAIYDQGGDGGCTTC